MWQYISSSFMASQYCYSMEMTRAMERHRQGEVRVIPILLRPVLFTGTPFAMLKMLPTNGKPVANWRNRDSAFVDIALGIERVVREEATKSTLSGQGQQSPPSQPWGAQMQPITPGGHQAGWPVPSPPRRRRGVLVSLTLVGLSLLLGIVVAGILFTLFTFRIPACPSGSPCTGSPNFLSIAVALLGTLVAILLIILWRRIIQARRRVKVIEEAERQRQEEARRSLSIMPTMVFTSEAERQRQEEARRREQEEAEQQRQEEAEQQRWEETRERKQEEDYYEQALQAYDRSPHLDPLARRGKGFALAALGRYDEALQSLYLSAVLDPRPATYARMGDVYLALRRYSDAVTAYERAIALDPQLAPAYASLGDALEQLGRTQDAEQAREQAKQLEKADTNEYDGRP